MKILIVAPYFPPKKGGVENYSYHISQLISQKGHEVIILTSGNNDSIEEIDEMKVIRIKPDLMLSNTPIDFNLKNKICRIIRENNIDIVNAHTPVPFYADMAARASKMNNIPFILTYHNDLAKNSKLFNLICKLYNFSFLRSLFSLSEKIITPSPYVYNESELVEEYKNKLIWIPPGVEIEKYTPGISKIHEIYNIPSKSKIVLFVGGMNKGHSHKGVDVLLQAFERVLKTQKDVYLMLAGSGNMIKEYQRLSDELGISKNVRFTGFVDENVLIDLYKTSYMLILPTITISEGFGMVLIEANACGRPVIGSNIGGIKYVIREGETGLLVPPKDVEELSRSIIGLLDDEELAVKMGKMGRNMVETEYTWKKSTIITEKVYKDVLKY